MPSNVVLFEKHNYNKIFIETGSYAGDGIRNAIFAGYKDIYSIELTDKYYQFCKNCFKYIDNVNLFHGDSVDRLPEVLANIKSPATFWLDAHYSGGETSFRETLTPLLNELDIIGKHRIKSHTIIIDDLREWNVNYPAIGFGIEEIKAKILSINKDYVFSLADGHVPDDVLVAEIRKEKPINIIVFSKDRAMQLDLFLRGFNKMVKDSDTYKINVLYTYSNDEFKNGYGVLYELYPDVCFHFESDFKQDLLDLVDVEKRHTVFFVDDNVFKDYLDFYDRQMDVFNEDGSILCRSLRLSRTLSYCYPTQKPMLQPKFDGNGVYNWKRAEGDYGYPMSVDGHIYRTSELLPYLSGTYTNPSTFEGSMASAGSGIPNIICYQTSVIINNPLNKVQTVNNNVHGDIDAAYLNYQFLQGCTIDHDPFIGLDNMSCHQEVPITFIQ